MKSDTCSINSASTSCTKPRRRSRRTMLFATGISCLCLALVQSLFLDTEMMVAAFVSISPTSKCNTVSPFNNINNKNYNKNIIGLNVLQSPLREVSTTNDITDDDTSTSSSSTTITHIDSDSSNNDTNSNSNSENIDENNHENNHDNDKSGFFSSSAIADGISKKIGRVENERIIFPEYETGEVTRVFSSLKYDRSDNDSDNSESNKQGGSVAATHDAGSVFGAASLVAGTMIGAGILALPSATAPVGFIPSTGAMGIAWLYMTMSGLLIAELSINRMGQSGKPGQGMLDLYEDSLGENWSKLGSAAYFGLHYCMMVAYIAQGGANLNAVLGLDTLGVPSGVPQVAFATTVAGGLFLAKPSTIRTANNVFVCILAVVFLGIIGLGVGTVDFHALVAPVNQHPEVVVDALPIIFLSLVFHMVVPTVVNQLEGDRGKITKAIVFGTAIPTLMFVAWNAVVLGNVGAFDGGSGAAGAIDPVALLQQASATSGGNGAILGTLVTVFSSLALVTSLIGFVYALTDSWTDVFNLPTKGPAYEKWKAPLFGLIFLPPLALSLADPDIFFTALDYGGAFGVSTLFLVLPPIMVWKQRYGDDEQNLLTKPMVPLGKLPLGSMWKAAGTLILEQGADKLGVFDFFEELF